MDGQMKKWLFVFQHGWESFLRSLKIKNEEGLFKFQFSPVGIGLIGPQKRGCKM